MRLTVLQLLFAASLVPLAASLQSIYFATLSQASSPHYLAFFSDSDPCTDGVLFPFGFALLGFRECDERLTILGHENVTFTGCPPTQDLYTQSLPTGVADDGVPALTCEPLSGPPYEDFKFCPYIPGNDQVNVGSVALIEYCS